jgi:hypothetical protein
MHRFDSAMHPFDRAPLRFQSFSANSLFVTARDDPQLPTPRAILHSMNRDQYIKLEQLPNVGSAIARDLRRIGVSKPRDLVKRDAYAMYEQLCRVTGQMHDPCVLDTFLSVVRFMQGARKRPWWAYTPERKRTWGSQEASALVRKIAGKASQPRSAKTRALRRVPA